MKKFMKRWMPLLLTLMVCVGTFWSSVVLVYASIADEAIIPWERHTGASIGIVNITVLL